MNSEAGRRRLRSPSSTTTSSLSDSNLNAVLQLIDLEMIKHSFYLVDTEFQTVLDPEYEGIVKPWVPTEYYE